MPARPDVVPGRDVVALRQWVADELVAHALSVAPNEACGLIAGDRLGGFGTTFHPARNALASPYRFDLHPEDLVRILDDIERAGLDLVAIFHSHPRSRAVPSALDRREARYPVPYLIYGAGDAGQPLLRAWRIEGSEVSVTLGYGGAAQDYAVVQHEDESLNHPNGGEAKYLEKPLLRRLAGMGERIGREVMHEFNVGGSKRLRAELNVLNVFNRKVARYAWVWLNRTSPDVRTRPSAALDLHSTNLAQGYDWRSMLAATPDGRSSLGYQDPRYGMEDVFDTGTQGYFTIKFLF